MWYLQSKCCANSKKFQRIQMFRLILKNLTIRMNQLIQKILLCPRILLIRMNLMSRKIR